ncbi:SDR family NAD(P)-dependent oxidoreductase [Actinomadura sp. SCN-SB]|uniref:SDR family NAD(P)-dependent oxidoreductase n=1 Tax=Actinomadura sp. SCN-SB TaxID=3373092 RepID=UPI003752C35A
MSETTVPGRLLGEGLAGRGVLCTGGAGGIGRAVCRQFALAGARVLVADRDEAACREVAGGLPGSGHEPFAADLSDPHAAASLPEAAEERLGSCDVLVHMAAVLLRKPLGEVSEADWDLQTEVNLKATFFLARAAGDLMRRRGRGGRVVLFASQAWWTGGYGGSVVYAAGKGGVVSLARGLAREYGPDGITVNTVAPGSVDTPMLRTGLAPEVLDGVLEATPLRRLGTPEEIATATLFLASDNASFISGATLNVSGGWLAY